MYKDVFDQRGLDWEYEEWLRDFEALQYEYSTANTASRLLTSVNPIYGIALDSSSKWYLNNKMQEFEFDPTDYTNADATPCIIAKSGHDPDTPTDNWFSTWITGQSVTLSGWGSGDIDAYSAGVTIGSVDAFTTFILNAAALSDIASLSTFKICVLHLNDYMDTAPTSGTLRTGVYWADHGTAENRPYLDYTAAAVAVSADNATFFGANF